MEGGRQVTALPVLISGVRDALTRFADRLTPRLLALFFVAVAVVATFVSLTADRFDNWSPNFATEALSLALTVAIVEKIVRREDQRRVQPQIDRALDLLSQAIVHYSMSATMDFLMTHPGADPNTVPSGTVEKFDQWNHGSANETAPRSRFFLEESVQLAQLVQRILNADRNVLPTDVVIDASNLVETFGKPFLDHVRDVQEDRGSESWVLLVMNNNVRRLAATLQRHRPLWLDPPPPPVA